jgi:Tfp pilus assembly protein FimT
MAQPTRSDDRGFVMVALLIAMAVAAIWMTADARTI